MPPGSGLATLVLDEAQSTVVYVQSYPSALGHATMTRKIYKTLTRSEAWFIERLSSKFLVAICVTFPSC